MYMYMYIYISLSLSLYIYIYIYICTHILRKVLRGKLEVKDIDQEARAEKIPSWRVAFF